jgi:hypothetical protein
LRTRLWLVPACVGCGHRVDDLAEHRGCEGGDGEVAGGGAVAVVVQGQRAPVPGVRDVIDQLHAIPLGSSRAAADAAEVDRAIRGLDSYKLKLVAAGRLRWRCAGRRVHRR